MCPASLIMTFAEPPPRSRHFSAVVGRQLCIYGGDLAYGKSELPTTLHVFCSEAEEWKENQTTGRRRNPAHHFFDGACTPKKHFIYLYGGKSIDEEGRLCSDCDCFCQLDCKNLKWVQLGLGGLDDRVAKCGCSMLCHAGVLLLFGGYDIMKLSRSLSIQPGAAYYEDQQLGEVITNELHIFNLKKGEWF